MMLNSVGTFGDNHAQCGHHTGEGTADPATAPAFSAQGVDKC